MLEPRDERYDQDPDPDGPRPGDTLWGDQALLGGLGVGGPGQNDRGENTGDREQVP